jgi:hypothetical protein
MPFYYQLVQNSISVKLSDKKAALKVPTPAKIEALPEF